MTPPLKVAATPLHGAAEQLAKAAFRMSDMQYDLWPLKAATADSATSEALNGALGAWAWNLAGVQAGAATVANSVKLAVGQYKRSDEAYTFLFDRYPTVSKRQGYAGTYIQGPLWPMPYFTPFRETVDGRPLTQIPGDDAAVYAPGTEPRIGPDGKVIQKPLQFSPQFPLGGTQWSPPYTAPTTGPTTGPTTPGGR